ncbi:hypothetical protein Q8A67_023448 [Cirrhinus molitorella]|uniref:interstitial collagenase n=1 Tax=Cirrhinus molitorella TaxID=172907 RepID=A0AA88TB77_9TELE|nr:hypothetical protein Q8A67_023448 [Cirrhinus molitorella]
MGIHRQLCFLASLLLAIHAGPILKPSDEEKAIAEDYLRKFFNLEDEMSFPRVHPEEEFNAVEKVELEEVKVEAKEKVDTLSVKLKEMQTFFGLRVTGKLDRETLEVMKKPRCGVSDVRSLKTSNLMSEGSPKWKTNPLTYRIENYTPDMTKAEVDHSIRRALQVWAEVTPLQFTRIYSDRYGTPDIMISFATTDHGDGMMFDIPTLAHAFPPGSGLGGDAHFDDDESFTFSNNSHNVFVLFLVAAHEFGHSLGLSHSSVSSDLMYSLYTFTDLDRSPLSSNDIKEIQALYGLPDCQNLVWDAVTTFRGETVFFKNGFYWRESQGRTVTQLPIRSFWPNAPDNIDAAYEDPVHNKLFLFKGSQVWAFDGQNLEPGYPKPLSSFGLPASLTRVDAAVHDNNSGKTLLFTNREYYSYDERQNRMDEGYPKRVNTRYAWVTGVVTAAHMSNGNTYLFIGRTLLEFSDRRFPGLLQNNYFLPC